jgi:hypothetical protein
MKYSEWPQWAVKQLHNQLITYQNYKCQVKFYPTENLNLKQTE